MISIAKPLIFCLLIGALLFMPNFGFAEEGLLNRPTQMDQNWGRSFETAKYLQILNPNAGKDLTPIMGIDGRVGERIMDGHIKGTAQKKSSSKEIGILTIK